MKFNEDLNASSAIVLGILQTGESYGYAIAQKVRGLSGGEVEWTDGMLYPILHRLQANRLIEARWGKSETGRTRKFYQLAAQARPVMDEDRRQRRTVRAILDRLWTSEISQRSASEAPTFGIPAV